MEHLIVLFYILSFTLGFSVILILLFLWIKNRPKILKLFLLCAVALTLILIEQMVTAYALTNAVESSLLKTLLRFVSAAGCSLLIYSFTSLTYTLLEKDMSTNVFSILVGYSMIPVLVSVMFDITGVQVILWLGSALFFANILYNTLMLLVHLSQIRFSMIRNGIRNLLLISLLLFPVLFADIFAERIGETFSFGLFSVFVFYSIFCAMSFFYIVKGFNIQFNRSRQQYNRDNSEAILDAFHITNREKEIIGFLVTGLTYRQIGEKLAISIPTVKTHVANIYKKMNVQNKIELINAVQSHHVPM